MKKCKDCGAKIYLARVGLHYKWLTNPRKRDSWHCGNDPDFPVRSHAPETARKDEDNA
jgi:hypothetical protein